MQLIVVTIDTLRELVRGQFMGTLGRRILREERMSGNAEAQAEQGGEETCWTEPADQAVGKPHCPSCCVQLVPPAGSKVMVPASLPQNPRSPVLPTVCGTPVTAYEL